MAAPTLSVGLAPADVNASASAYAFTLTTKPTATSDQIVVVSYAPGASGAFSISDALGGTWTTPVSMDAAGDVQDLHVWTRQALSGDVTGTTYTIATPTAATALSLAVLVVHTGAFDVAGNQPAGTNATSGSSFALCPTALTPASTTDLIIGIFGAQTAATITTAPSGETAIGSDAAGNLFLWDQALASSAAVQPSVTATFGAGTATAGAVLLFKPSGVTRNITASDTDPGMTDAISLAQSTTSTVETAASMSDSPSITVTSAPPPAPPPETSGSSHASTTIVAQQKIVPSVGAIEIDLPPAGDFSIDATGDLILAVDTYGYPIATKERLVRLVLTNPLEDPFNTTYGSGSREMVGEPVTGALLGGLRARIASALASDPSVLSSPAPTVDVMQVNASTVIVDITAVAVSGEVVTIPSLPLGS